MFSNGNGLVCHWGVNRFGPAPIHENANAVPGGTKMYTSQNFKSKKALKEAVASGQTVTIYAPGLGTPKRDGWDFVEGPHYPEPHRWYAQVLMQDGKVIKVK